jgi:hypothetical protein
MNVNPRQRLLLLTCAVVVGAMLIYPPLAFRGTGRGYGLIFSIEAPLSINAGQLLVQWVAVAIIGGILFVLLGGQSPESNPTSSTALAPEVAKELGSTVLIPVLRVLRALMAVIGWLQVIGIVSSALALFAPAGYDIASLGAWLAGMSIKAAVGALCIWMSSVLKSLINRLHIRWHGTPHPALERRWGL